MRRDSHGAEAHAGLRVLGPGLEEAARHVRRRPRRRHDQVVPVSAPARHRVLPSAPGAAPRPEAAEPPHQSGGRAEAGGLWPRPRLRDPRAQLHARGGDAVVPRHRTASRADQVRDAHGHLVAGLPHRGDGHRAGSLPGRLADRHDLQDLPPPGNSHRRGLAGRLHLARVQAHLPALAGHAAGEHALGRASSWRHRHRDAPTVFRVQPRQPPIRSAA
mmetsp:Transcript_90932/g.253952  ORF Transcript_90932/g.253952 Transcript_90932/m.253952 type:complete len:217 (-) Transcript_90932:160-810(-)